MIHGEREKGVWGCNGEGIMENGRKWASERNRNLEGDEKERCL